MADGGGPIVWGTETEIASSLAPALSEYQNRWLMGAVQYNKHVCPEGPLQMASGLRSKVRAWKHPLTFSHESALRFLIDLEAWHLLEGVRLQRWATVRGPQWQRALSNALLGQDGSDVEVRELYHGRGRIPHEALLGVRAALCIGGSATLRVGETTIHLPRGKGVAVDLDGWRGGREVPERRHVAWAGGCEQRTRTIVLLWTNPGTLRPVPSPPPQRLQADIQEERAAEEAEAREEAGDEEDDGDGGDSDAEAEEAADERLRDEGNRDPQDASGETVAFKLGALNVQGWARKQKEVEATATQFDLDALFCSETRGREPGWLEADGFRILRAESKAWWASTSESIYEYGDSTRSAASLGLRVMRGGAEILRLLGTYFPPASSEEAIQVATWLDWMELQVAESTCPLVFVGDMNFDVLTHTPTRDRIRSWGYQIFPTAWTWTWQGAGANSSQRSMLDFLLAPAGVKVESFRVVGNMPVRTDHRLLVATLSLPGGGSGAPMGVMPRIINESNVDPKRIALFAAKHAEWTQHMTIHPELPVGAWMDMTLRIAAETVGAPRIRKGRRLAEEDWAALMIRKRRWAERQGAQVGTLANSAGGIADARARLRWRKHGYFTQITAINDATGARVTGPRMMTEFARQMTEKQGRPLQVVPDVGAGVTSLPYTGDQVGSAIAGRPNSAAGHSGAGARMFKWLQQVSVDGLASVIRATGALPYIEVCLRIVAHWVLKKRPVVYTEDDTRPLALEEEVLKLIAVLLLREADPYVADRQAAYQPARGVSEVRRGIAMLLDHCSETSQSLALYKRDKKNAFGTVGIRGVAYLLQQGGVRPEGARWFQLYQRRVRVVTLTGAGTTKAWVFEVGVFQGNPLAPRVYLQQEELFMREVGPTVSGIPPVDTPAGPVTFDPERYSDDEVIPASGEAALTQILDRQEHVAPRWRVVYVPNKEEYLFLEPQPNGGTKAGTLTGDRYATTRRRLVRDGIRVLGAQVSRKAAVIPVRGKLLLTAELWDQAARPVDSFGEMAVLYKEQMDAQIRNQAETIGLTEAVIKKIAGRLGRAWRRQLNLHFRTDSSTLWALLEEALHLVHPRSVAYKAMVTSVLRVMNGRRRDWAAWAVLRWTTSPPGSHERSVRAALNEVGLTITSLEEAFGPWAWSRSGEQAPADRPWEGGVSSKALYIYVDCGGGEDNLGCGGGMVVRIEDRTWEVEYALPRHMDNTTGELIMQQVGHSTADRAFQAGASYVELVYDARSAESLLKKLPERVKHPVRRAIVGARGASQAVCWWVRSHQDHEQQQQTTQHRLQGNIQVDLVTHRAAARSKAGERSPLPFRIDNAWVVQGELTWSQRQLKWPIQVPATLRPPMDLGPHFSDLLRSHPEQALIAAPLHLELWHPPTQSCGLCSHDRADLRYRCPCHRPRWEAALAGTGEPWRIMGTTDLRFRYTAPGRPLDLLSVGDKDKANLSWGAVPRSRYVPMTHHTMAAFLSWVEVIKAMNRRMGS